jgi:hypothetical protein
MPFVTSALYCLPFLTVRSTLIGYQIIFIRILDKLSNDLFVYFYCTVKLMSADAGQD